MKSFQELVALYQQQHQSKTNRLMHYIGVPATIFGLFIVLNWVNLDFGTVWKISFSWLLLALAAVYYFILGQYKLATITTIVLVIILLIASWIAGPYPSGYGVVLFVIFFFGGLGVLFVGSGMEKTKEGMIRNLWQLMVAPLMLIDELMTLFGLGSQIQSNKPTVRPDLKKGPTHKHTNDDDHH